MSDDRSTRIRELNDRFRTTGVGGQIVMTRGVSELGETLVNEIALAVKTFDTFTPDNDAYGEHDFGAFEIEGHQFFWKIDYYDSDMIHGSNDASDPNVTTRVLTIMLRDEY